MASIRSKTRIEPDTTSFSPPCSLTYRLGQSTAVLYKCWSALPGGLWAAKLASVGARVPHCGTQHRYDSSQIVAALTAPFAICHSRANGRNGNNKAQPQQPTSAACHPLPVMAEPPTLVQYFAARIGGLRIQTGSIHPRPSLPHARPRPTLQQQQVPARLARGTHSTQTSTEALA
jgi:hypothetical protein